MARQDAAQPIERKAYSVREFEQATGLSHSTTCRLISSGRLKSIKIGGRRLILPEGIDELLTSRG